VQTKKLHFVVSPTGTCIVTMDYTLRCFALDKHPGLCRCGGLGLWVIIWTMDCFMVKQPCFQVLGTLKGAFDAVFYRLRWQSFWSSNPVQVFVFSITAPNVGG
jgi:hypothetical protein